MDLVDIWHDERTATLWLKLDEDCWINRVGTHIVGEEPFWLNEEASNVGWHELLSTETFDEINWALEQGLCPGQIFAVRLEVWWSRSGSYYEEEWELESRFELVERQYIAPDEIAARWQEWIDRGYE